MITLGYNVAAIGEELKKLVRRTSDVGTDTEGDPTARDLVRNASGAVVTDWQGSDAEITYNRRKRSFVGDWTVAVRKSFAALVSQNRRLGHMYGNVVFLEKRLKSRDMIGMLVSYENGVDLRKLYADGTEHRCCRAAGNSEIDEYICVSRGDQGAVGF